MPCMNLIPGCYLRCQTATFGGTILIHGRWTSFCSDLQILAVVMVGTIGAGSTSYERFPYRR